MPLLDLTGVRIRVSMGTLLVDASPFKAFDYDPSRLVVILYNGAYPDRYPIIARTAGGVVAAGGMVTYAAPMEMYGAEEIWVGGTDDGVTLLPNTFVYQAIYRA